MVVLKENVQKFVKKKSHTQLSVVHKVKTIEMPRIIL